MTIEIITPVTKEKVEDALKKLSEEKGKRALKTTSVNYNGTLMGWIIRNK